MSRQLSRLQSIVKAVCAALVGLALVIGVGGLGAPASADPVMTATTLEASAEAPHPGDTVTFTARVTLEDGETPVSTGAVEFRVAADMFEIGGPGVVVRGPVALDPDGEASIEVELTPEDLPFLAEDDSVVAIAQYLPVDPDLAGTVSAPVQFFVTDEVIGEETTTVVTGPSVATVGQATTLTASVTPVTAAGTVQFAVNDNPVGGPVLVTGGSASRSFTFTAAGTATVTAAFTPSTPAYAVSFDDTGLDVAVAAAPAIATTTTVTGPKSSPGSFLDMLTAKVVPATAAGTVRFAVDGAVVGTAPLINGTASVGHRFVAAGLVTVTATFVPSGAAYATSEGTAIVAVTAPHALPTASPAAAATGTAVGQGTSTLSGCMSESDEGAGRVAARKAVSRAALRARIRSAILAKISGFSRPGATATAETAEDGCGDAGRVAAGRSARVTKVTVPCAATDDGYVCDLGDVPAGTAFKLTVRYPLPAEAAGQKLQATATAAAVDLVSGVETTLVSKTTTVAVPKRTALSVSLAPVKRITSVKRGAAATYRVVVKNAGVIASGKIRACVTLGAGAKVKAAKGATIHGRKACWTLPSLKKGKSAIRTLTLVAPRKKGKLKISLSVVPPKALAAPVKLTGLLPVK